MVQYVVVCIFVLQIFGLLPQTFVSCSNVVNIFYSYDSYDYVQ